MLNTGLLPDFNGMIEILCLAAAFYYVFYFLQGTRGAPMMAGLIMIFVILSAATRFFRLEALTWLLDRLSVYLAVALLVLVGIARRASKDEQHRSYLFTLVLAFLGLYLTFGVELFYIWDIFGSRMNTVFKVHYQVWILLAALAGPAVVMVLGGLWGRTGLRATIARLGYLTVAVLLGMAPVAHVMAQRRPRT